MEHMKGAFILVDFQAQRPKTIVKHLPEFELNIGACIPLMDKASK